MKSSILTVSRCRRRRSLIGDILLLIFLDVDLSGEMDGFALCKKLRSFPLHQKTPVVFVTSSSGFESKARSVLSGGNDLIGKPFPMLELGVKALTYIANAKL